jgi:hypothetical protein
MKLQSVPTDSLSSRRLHNKRKMTQLPPNRRCLNPEPFQLHFMTPPAPQADELRRAEDQRKADERRAAEVQPPPTRLFSIITRDTGSRASS